MSDMSNDPLLAAIPKQANGSIVVGGAKIIRKIGQGGMGAVYEGHKELLDVRVAVKLLPAHLAGKDASFIKRFVLEAQTTAQIDHPNLIRVFDVGEQGGVYFLIMEFVQGYSVMDMLEEQGTLSERAALEIVLGAAHGLRAAHEKHIIHRDIKPDNIMIRAEDGRVKIADLGLAKKTSSEEDLAADDAAEGMGLTASGAALGTPYYMPPEQAMDAKTADHRADIYSLGATLYHMLAGEVPFQAPSLLPLLMKIRDEAPPKIRDKRPELQEVTEAVTLTCMAKNPDDRYQSMADLIQAVEAALVNASGEGGGYNAAGTAIGTMSGSKPKLDESAYANTLATGIDPIPGDDGMAQTLTMGKTAVDAPGGATVDVPPPKKAAPAPAAAEMKPAMSAPAGAGDFADKEEKKSGGGLVVAVIVGALLLVGAIIGAAWYVTQKQPDDAGGGTVVEGGGNKPPDGENPAGNGGKPSHDGGKPSENGDNGGNRPDNGHRPRPGGLSPEDLEQWNKHLADATAAMAAREYQKAVDAFVAAQKIKSSREIDEGLATARQKLLEAASQRDLREKMKELQGKMDQADAAAAEGKKSEAKALYNQVILESRLDKTFDFLGEDARKKLDKLENQVEDPAVAQKATFDKLRDLMKQADAAIDAGEKDKAVELLDEVVFTAGTNPLFSEIAARAKRKQAELTEVVQVTSPEEQAKYEKIKGLMADADAAVEADDAKKAIGLLDDVIFEATGNPKFAGFAERARAMQKDLGGGSDAANANNGDPNGNVANPAADPEAAAKRAEAMRRQFEDAVAALEAGKVDEAQVSFLSLSGSADAPEDVRAKSREHLLSVQKYQSLLFAGDGAMNTENYETAAKKFEEAAAVLKTPAVEEKLQSARDAAETRRRETEEAERRRVEALNRRIAGAVEDVAAERFTAARRTLKDLLREPDLPEKQAAKARAELKSVEDYLDLVAEGDGANAARQYDVAIAKYTAASELIDSAEIRARLETANAAKKKADADIAAAAGAAEAEAAAKAERIKRLTETFDAAKTAMAAGDMDTAKYSFKALSEAPDAPVAMKAESAKEYAGVEKYQALLEDAEQAAAASDFAKAEAKLGEAKGLYATKDVEDRLAATATAKAEWERKQAEEAAAQKAAEELRKRVQDALAAAAADLAAGNLDEADAKLNGIVNDPDAPADLKTKATELLPQVASKRKQMRIDALRRQLADARIKLGQGEIEPARAALMELSGAADLPADIAAQAAEDLRTINEYQALLFAGDGALNAEDFDTAIAKYDAATKLFPAKAVYDKLADAREKKADLEKAKAEAERKLRAECQAILDAADAAVAAEDFGKAAEALKTMNAKEGAFEEYRTKARERLSRINEYRNLIGAGDAAVKADQYDVADRKYSDAAKLFSTAEAQSRIKAAIDGRKAYEKAMAAKAAAERERLRREAVQKMFDDAEKSVGLGDLVTAKASFQNVAESADADAETKAKARGRIGDIDKYSALLEEAERQEKFKEYDKALESLSAAKALFDTKDAADRIASTRRARDDHLAKLKAEEEARRKAEEERLARIQALKDGLDRAEAQVVSGDFAGAKTGVDDVMKSAEAPPEFKGARAGDRGEDRGGGKGRRGVQAVPGPLRRRLRAAGGERPDAQLRPGRPAGLSQEIPDAPAGGPRAAGGDRAQPGRERGRPAGRPDRREGRRSGEAGRRRLRSARRVVDLGLGGGDVARRARRRRGRRAVPVPQRHRHAQPQARGEMVLRAGEPGLDRRGGRRGLRLRGRGIRRRAGRRSEHERRDDRRAGTRARRLRAGRIRRVGLRGPADGKDDQFRPAEREGQGGLADDDDERRRRDRAHGLPRKEREIRHPGLREKRADGLAVLGEQARRPPTPTRAAA